MTSVQTVRQYSRYLVEFQPRPEYQGRPRKPGLDHLVGLRFVAMAVWRMDAGDPYPDEFAFSHDHCSIDVRQQLMVHQIPWFAEGDLKVIGVVSHNEHRFNDTLHPVPKDKQDLSE